MNVKTTPWRDLSEWSPLEGALDVVRLGLRPAVAGLGPESGRDSMEISDVLSKDELERAGRLVVAGKRSQFVAARVGLRRTLGLICKQEPGELRFSVSEHGKPFLEEVSGGGRRPCFNLSHSGDWALLSIASTGRIGCDIEQVRASRPLARIAERFFAPEENRLLLGVSQAELATLFYRGWTRKEAYVKAIGTGLTFSSRRFVVSLATGSGRHLLSSEYPDERPESWQFFDVDVAAGYDASVCVEVEPQIVRFWNGPTTDIRTPG